jgi:carboxylate-amine ligase
MDSWLILDQHAREDLVTADLARLLVTLEPVAERLGCVDELAGIDEIVRHGPSYVRQRRVAEANGGRLDAVVASLVSEMRVGQPVPLQPR